MFGRKHLIAPEQTERGVVHQIIVPRITADKTDVQTTDQCLSLQWLSHRSRSSPWYSNLIRFEFLFAGSFPGLKFVQDAFKFVVRRQ